MPERQGALAEVVSTTRGKELRATSDIVLGEVVARFTGDRLPIAEVPQDRLNYIVRLDRDYALDAASIVRFANHSCDLNCVIDDHLNIAARRAIARGEEITISYDVVTTDKMKACSSQWNDAWTFVCRCGSPDCRGVINKYVVQTSEEPDGKGWRIEDFNPAHTQQVIGVAKSCGVFTEDEIDLLGEDIEDFLGRGGSSAEKQIDVAKVMIAKDRVAGYCFYGQLSATDRSWILYWIFVHKDLKGTGAAHAILNGIAADILKRGGLTMFIETSDQDDFAPARGLYRKAGFVTCAVLPEYYGPGISKVIFVRKF